MHALLLHLAFFLPSADDSAEKGTTPHPVLERIAVIGASGSDGFLLPLEVNAMVTLADAVDAARADSHPPPFRRTSSFFFQNPHEHGKRFVRATRRYDPTLVIAADFLFWFAYGFTFTEEMRAEDLETGLAILDEVGGTLLVGDIPYMMPAATEGSGIMGSPMLRTSSVPEPETLEKMNRRIREWAAERGNTFVIPMAEFIRKVHSSEPVSLRGNSWEEDSLEKLMNTDLLHATLEGTVGVALIAFHTLTEEHPDVSSSDFIWDKDLVVERIYAATREERAQRGDTISVEEGGAGN